MEGAGSHDHDRGVDEQGQAEGDVGVDRREADRLALAAGDRASRRRACTSDGVQVEVVRHHGGPDDADGQVEHGGIGDDRGVRNEAGQHGAPAAAAARRSGTRSRRRSTATRAMIDRLEPAQAAPLQRQEQHHVDAGQRRRRAASGMPNSRLRPIAMPITSARLQATIAISHSSQSTQVDARRKSARGRPAPDRGRRRCRAAPAAAWNSMASRLDAQDDRRAGRSRSASRRRATWPSCPGPCSRRRRGSPGRRRRACAARGRPAPMRVLAPSAAGGPAGAAMSSPIEARFAPTAAEFIDATAPSARIARAGAVPRRGRRVSCEDRGPRERRSPLRETWPSGLRQQS